MSIKKFFYKLFGKKSVEEKPCCCGEQPAPVEAVAEVKVEAIQKTAEPIQVSPETPPMSKKGRKRGRRRKVQNTSKQETN